MVLLSPTKRKKPQIMLNDNGSGGREWDLKYLEWLKLQMKIFHSLRPKKLPMRDGNIVYLNPPSPGVRGIMLEYGISRKQAEEWWNIH